MNRVHQWLCRSGHWRSTVAQRLPWAIGDTDLGPNVLEIGSGPGVNDGPAAHSGASANGTGD